MAPAAGSPLALNGSANIRTPSFPITPEYSSQETDSPSPRQWPSHPGDLPISMWDSGVFITELFNLDMLPRKKTKLSNGKSKPVGGGLGVDDCSQELDEERVHREKPSKVPRPVFEGTYRGTQLAVTKVYDLIEQKYSSYMDVASFEPAVPRNLPLAKKRKYYTFSDPEVDHYPPHLNLAGKPKDPNSADPAVREARQRPAHMFEKMRFAQLASLLPAIIPKTFKAQVAAKIGTAAAFVEYGDMGSPDQGKTIADIEEYNREQRADTGTFSRNDIFNLPNIGDLNDWYSDERFAQQNFTGTNPTTIELASDFWIKHFIDNATDPEEDAMKDKITRLAEDEEQRKRLYMQDYSYFRKAAGKDEAEEISCIIPEDERGEGDACSERRYGVASVCLLHLDSDNKLNPLAIVIDWKGSAENSVTIYNKELTTSDQAEDWPWRYAKTCVQVSDWLRHEVTAHLINTHLIEEAIIVASQRCFENDHPVFQVLYPHWQKTLSRNAAARDTLVPHVIIALIGLEQSEALKLIQSEYANFDFQAGYVPRDLAARGFPPEELNDKKFRNYAYARCIHSMWWKIRAFVSDLLSLYYTCDQEVADDEYIADWCATLQKPAARTDGGAGMPSFPTIKTREQLIDAVTMVIHLASPQHTAVNYLQNYYQAFVINKPACFYTPPPTSKAELAAFTEEKFVRALPINHTREWLLASHIPYLLSFKPGDKESLISYAASKWRLYRGKEGERERGICQAALGFYQALSESEGEFKRYAKDTWDSNVVEYDVLSPSWNAVSILI